MEWFTAGWNWFTFGWDEAPTAQRVELVLDVFIAVMVVWHFCLTWQLCRKLKRLEKMGIYLR